MRGGAPAVALLLWSCVPAMAELITQAEYETPTQIYPHAVLGDDVEWKDLIVTAQVAPEGGSGGKTAYKTFRVTAPGQSVFEDIAPRLWDITGDGAPEVVVVHSDQRQGARLQVFGLVAGELEIIAQTPPIGTRFRWLAPVGAADFDGDGAIEIAYVDRPHLAKTLRVWRYSPESFREIATLRGVSNHRIGEDFISGGVRLCGELPQMVLADAGWDWVLLGRLDADGVSVARAGRFAGPDSFEQAMSC